MKQVLNVKNSLDLYVSTFADCLNRCTSNKILSIGSGECLIEISIAKQLIKIGVEDFKIICTELSSERLKRGEKNALAAGVEKKIEFKLVDFNNVSSECLYAGVMAHHVLHHIVDLENIIQFIDASMEDGAAFVSIDMIGRNGHMRYPEALVVVDMLWDMIPDHYKFNHQFKKQHAKFVNWNCAQKGFEGVRAQDILPLLIERFSFEKFLAYGNIIDPFIERGYGHNLDVNFDADVRFIDFVQQLNELLIDIGYITPTMMDSVLRKKNCADDISVYKHWTPEYCVYGQSLKNE
jgi:2-polyprenyl-3-methyl-5-hydroxy-6-metoxy-1,4-benzoquinol methylase